MTIHYPNGKSYLQSKQPKSLSQDNNDSFSRRGMSLEAELNDANAYYLATGQAVIHKKPTPIQIVKVDYPQRSKAIIREAYFRQPSTTDYNGVYRGFYLDFDAKETKNKTAFPFRNFHAHQIEHMRQCLQQQAICFAIIRFVIYDRIFLVPADYLINKWDEQNHGGRKSIPLTAICEHGYEIKYALNPLIPYLDAVDRFIKDIHR